MGHTAAFGTAVICYLLAALFLWMYFGQRSRAQGFVDGSLEATCRVVDKRIETSTSGSSARPGEGSRVERHFLVYEFEEATAGETIQSKSRVSEPEWKEAAVGHEFTVTYTRADPTVTSLTGGDDWRQGVNLARTLWIAFIAIGTIAAAIAYATRR